MEPVQQRIRQSAQKVTIKAIIKGTYIKNEEEFAPNYIEIADKKISRVNIIGIVVEVERDEPKVSSINIDDGSARIPIRCFEDSSIPTDIKIGDIINIIGRPRQYANEKYILPEIIKKTNEKWMRIRKLELEKDKSFISQEEILVEEVPINEEIIKTSDNGPDSIIANREKIMQYIKEKDIGNGVEIEDILKETYLENPDKIIKDMLKEGEIFEIAHGRVKTLE